jgi:hypothetical protein
MSKECVVVSSTDRSPHDSTKITVGGQVEGPLQCFMCPLPFPQANTNVVSRSQPLVHDHNNE